MERKSFVVVLAVLALLSGCGGSSTSIPGQTAVDIFVDFSTLPTSAIVPGGTATMTATVAHDDANAGVSWSCKPANNCGSFSPASTGSGVSTSYTAPVSAPPQGVVSVTATSVSDVRASVSINCVISETASNATLKGQYVFFLTSPTGNRGTASLAGSVTLDGSGKIEGGVVDIVSPAVLDLQDPILPTSSNSPPVTSSYAVDPAGRGTMRLRTANGQTLDFSVALTSPTHALLAEVDGNPGSGSLDLQQHPDSTFEASQISGGYSFTMTGTAQANSAMKVSFGGVFLADGLGGLDSGTLDINNAGVMSNSPFGGSFTAPDSNGHGTLQLNSGRSFTYYIISQKALRILESDNFNLMGGTAYAQGGSTIFLANDCFYQHSGWSSGGLTITAGQFFIPEGDNDITKGISDSNAGGSPTSPNTGVKVSGTFSDSDLFTTGTLNVSDAAGVSTFNLYIVDQSVDILDPSNSSPDFFNGAGNVLLLHTDANINGTGFIILKRTTDFPSVIADHAIQLTNSVTTSTGTNEVDLVGVVSSNGLSSFVNGLADYDQNGSNSASPVLGASLTGSVDEADGSNRGRLTGRFTVPTPSTAGAYPFITAGATSFTVSYYEISDSQMYVMQTDQSANVSGYLLRQLFP